MMNREMNSRTRLLIGDSAMERLSQAHILIVGVGGVGGYVAELLVRSGVGELTIVDADVVQESNINRQLIATHTAIGHSKVSLWRERLLAINPNLKLHTREVFIRDEETNELLESNAFTFVVDAIDTLSPKAYLIKALIERDLPFISSMGAGAKFDPREIKIGRIDKAINCKLAKTIRKKLRRMGVPTKFRVVYSTELAHEDATIETDGSGNKKSIAGTIAHMPASFGCFIAYDVINQIINSSTTDAK